MNNELSLKRSTNSEMLPFVEKAMENLESLMKLGEVILGAKMAPKHFYETDNYGKPDYNKPLIGVFVSVVIHGQGLGIPMMAAMQDVVPVHGRMNIMGDAAKALAFSSPLVAEWKETITGSIAEENYCVKIYTKRKDGREFVRSFSVEEAKRAGLWVPKDAETKHKFGAWYKYPDRMIMYRVLGFILRDAYPEVMKGTKIFEEMMGATETIDQEATVIEDTKKTGAQNIADKIVERAQNKIAEQETKATPVNQEIKETTNQRDTVLEDEPIDKILTRLNYVKKVKGFILEDENLPEKLKKIHNEGGDAALKDYVDNLSHVVIETIKTGETVKPLTQQIEHHKFPFVVTEVDMDELGEPNGEPRSDNEVNKLRGVFKTNGLTIDNYTEMHKKAGITNYDSNVSLCQFGSIKQLSSLLEVLQNEFGK